MKSAPDLTVPGRDPLVGQVLDGRFRIVEPIGSGGMGRVYRAVQLPLDRVVAVKVLDRNGGPGADPAFRQRFFIEAALTAKLKHPSTVTVIDYGCTAEGIYFLAMEFLDGETLADVIGSDGPVGWRRALNIAAQVCRSLREAHNLGVVHRDLKPANVMLLPGEADREEAKVLDFGLVKSFRQGKSLANRELTQQGVLMGSPLYMSPEQAEHNRVDPRSDIYSLGVLLYEAITGKVPFPGTSHLEVILKHVHDKPSPLARPGLEVPPHVEALVLRCLEKEPNDRFQSMDEVLDAIHATGVGAETPGSGIRADSSRTPTPRPAAADRGNTSGWPIWKKLVLPVAVLLGVVGGVIILGLTARSGDLAEPNERPVTALQLPSPAAVGPSAAVPPTSSAPTAVPSGAAESAQATAPANSSPTSAPVMVRVSSEPPGAKVRLGATTLGITPFEYGFVPGPDGVARADLLFRKVGYRAKSVSFASAGPQAEVKAKLAPAKKVVRRKPAKRPPSKLGEDTRRTPSRG